MADRDYFKLDVDAPLFEELSKLPTWWEKVLNDKDLYVNVRKDNRIFVYYQGAAVMKGLHFGRTGLVCQIDKEYQRGWTKVDNCMIAVDEVVKHLEKIKENIENYYAGKPQKPEQGDEKQIQGELYLEGEFIDTEYAFVYSRSNIIRIDLITITEKGTIEFVELKRISDDRLLHKEGSREDPEIIRQMKRYNKFIADKKDDIKPYYEKVQSVLKKIGVENPLASVTIKGVEPKARLLFAPYKDKKEKHPLRVNRVTRIDELLKDNNITSNIDELLEMIKD